MRPNDMPRPFAPDHSDGDDLVQRLRGAGAVALGRDEQATIRKAADEIERLRAEVARLDAGWNESIQVANGYAERAGKAERELAELRESIDKAPVAIMDTRDVLCICAPTEEDFPALYAIQGQRVRLVRED